MIQQCDPRYDNLGRLDNSKDAFGKVIWKTFKKNQTIIWYYFLKLGFLSKTNTSNTDFGEYLVRCSIYDWFVPLFSGNTFTWFGLATPLQWMQTSLIFIDPPGFKRTVINEVPWEFKSYPPKIYIIYHNISRDTQFWVRHYSGTMLESKPYNYPTTFLLIYSTLYQWAPLEV